MIDDPADRGQDAARRFHRLIRRAVTSFLARYGFLARYHLPALARKLDGLIPALAGTFREAQLAAWVFAAKESVEAAGIQPVNMPAVERPKLESEATPGGIRFPQIDAAARWVDQRIPFSPEDFADLDSGAKQVAFTVAGAVTESAVEAVRAAVSDSIRTGGTFPEFKRAVAEHLDGSDVSEASIETVYRTTIGRAYSAGQIAAIENPLVASEFPYLLYSATHDSRVEDTHLAMESLGLDGTAVYRADDPIWDVFYPPWRWSCRCIVIPMSIEDAAERGVKEAQRWLASGVPPVSPQWVEFPPFRPPPGWVPTGRRLVVA